MKLLVFAHRLQVGGTQVNAIDLMTALREDFGYDVTLFATPGPMLEVVQQRGIRFIPAPDAVNHPSLARMKALRNALDVEKPDLLHVWDWWQCLDAYYGAFLTRRIPMVVSDMQSESINRLLPLHVPTTFGTPELVDRARRLGRTKVTLLVPPVDTEDNAPGTADPKAFRAQMRIGEGELLLVTVSRLVEHLKGESLRRTIDAVAQLASELPIRFVIAGEGNVAADLNARAAAVNRAHQRTVIELAGSLLDPRQAYAAADIVIGMGGSALRALAFSKPVIVVGGNGFSKPFTPVTSRFFHYNGLYGVGDGDADNRRLIDIIRALADRRGEWNTLGEFSRSFVVDNFGLRTVATALDATLTRALAQRPTVMQTLSDGVRTATVMAAGSLRRAAQAHRKSSGMLRTAPEFLRPTPTSIPHA